MIKQLSTSDIDGMLFAIAGRDPRPEYSLWLRIYSGLVNERGEAEATDLMAHHFPEEKAGELARRAAVNGCPKRFSIRQNAFAGRGNGWQNGAGSGCGHGKLFFHLKNLSAGLT